jgi:DNA invertase Pin-like site-specific DNA recombinase
VASYGYARVSTEDQHLDLQRNAMLDAGVPPENIVADKMSGTKQRPLFDVLVERLQAGDKLYVWKVDRLGRRASEVQRVAEGLTERGVHVIVTTLGVDLATPAGKLVFGALCQIAQFERETLVERTNAGLAAAKRRGKKLGRQFALDQHQRAEAARMVADGKTYGEVAAMFRVSRAAAFRCVARAKAEQPVAA